MRPGIHKTRIINHATVLLAIVSCSIFTRYLLLHLENLNITRPLYLALFWLFPHELFERLNALLLSASGPQNAVFPFLSLAFCLYLLTGIVLFRRTHRDSRFIAGSCWALILSIVVSVFFLFIDYFRHAGNDSAFLPVTTTTGVTGTINEITSFQKPSFFLLVLQVTILALYAAEAFYLLGLIRKFKWRRKMQDA